jgi:hypothetical protein
MLDMFRVAEAFVNQKKIDAKIKQLNQNTATFLKQTQQWMLLLESFNDSLKAYIYFLFFLFFQIYI